MLKRWAPGFTPLYETFRNRFLWVLLLDFPLELWSLTVLEAVANSIGRLVYFDDRSLRWVNKKVAWVLVDMDLDSGLPDSLDICIGDHRFSQPLDYW